VASHGLSDTSSHRRTLLTLNGRARIAQRFAIDWTRIGSDGLVFRGDPARNGDWTPYGAEVLAVADGRIVEAVDGIPENDPTSDVKAVAITFDNATGNHLVLDIGGGLYALYAHLRTGSLRVHAGDRVKAGAVIAALGNSGKADAPHLHFQVMDGPSPLASEGAPFVFDSFELEGHIPSLGVLADGTGWKPTEPAQLRRRETPLENAVVRFPR
jgi:murein DD-endopeptidase MepM/ murein hydrolase activator NlpD